MPPPPGMELGPSPPPVPRDLPKGFAFRLLVSQNIATIVGGLMFAVATPITWGTLQTKTWAASIPGLMALGGFFMLRYGLTTAGSVLRAFRKGRAAEGTIASVKLDTTQSINNQHPWKVVYHFMVEGHQHEGVLVSWDSTLISRAAGQPLWVLYVESDPTQNTVYPPYR